MDIIFPDFIPPNRAEFLWYCKRFIGQPYVWGGNGPYFDCSGYVCAMLRPFGRVDTKDYASSTLFEMFPDGDLTSGNLIFFGTDGHIRHVEIVVDQYKTIGADRGDKHTTLANFWRKGAFVQYRMLGERKDVVGIKNPWSPDAGDYS